MKPTTLTSLLLPLMAVVPLMVFAGNSPGLEITGPVVLDTLPHKFSLGSVKVSEKKAARLADHARITSAEAARLVTLATQGTVIATELENEGGVLIWSVDTVLQSREVMEVAIDAGTGYLLAVETEDEDDED